MNNRAKMIIDLNKLKENTLTLKDTYGDYNYIFADVKNNAHGMGYGIIETLKQNGINYSFVSSLEEALEIRKLNHQIKILINFEIAKDSIFDAALNNFTITVSNIEYLKSICTLNLKDKLNIHLLIDNGHNKIGLKNKVELKTALDLIKSNNKFILEGIYTDFTTYGITDEYYYTAYQTFINLIKEVKDQELIIHVNEPCMYHRKNKLINGLRFDLTLLGIEENISENFVNNLKIKSIEKKYNNLLFPNIDLSLIFAIETEVVGISRAYKNTLVGRNYIVKEDLNLAIIPIGYKDGITSSLENVLIQNKLCPIVADEIDYSLVISPNTAKVGDKVVIINDKTDIYEVINLLKTNRSYLMCILNNDLNKVYINIPHDDNLL